MWDIFLILVLSNALGLFFGLVITFFFSCFYDLADYLVMISVQLHAIFRAFDCY